MDNPLAVDLYCGLDEPKFILGADGSRSVTELTELFDTCFRIQREACEAAGRHIPLIVENVRGAQKWVGRARWNFGSFYLWGDVPALMPATMAAKVCGLNWSNHGKSGYKAQGFNITAAQRFREDRGTKCGGGWFGSDNPSLMRQHSSRSDSRKAARAIIAKIPLPLSRYIARTFKPILAAGRDA